MVENLVLVLFFLCCSSFFCLSEGALFSLSRPQRDVISRQGGNVSRSIDRLLSNSHGLITTILFADEVFNIAYSSVIGLTARSYFQDSPEQTVALISLAVASPTLLVFGEIVPKTAGVKFPRTISRLVAVPLYFFHVAITPVRIAIEFLSGSFARALGADLGRRRSDDISSEELEVLVEMGREEGVLNEVEKYLAEGFFKLETLPAHSIMTPAVDCFMLPGALSPLDAVGEVRKRGHSRIPVYGDSRDDVQGVLYGKDLIKIDFGGGDIPSSLSGCVREPYFIPRAKPADALLREFQRNRIHIAIVVDEYGRFDGLVTMEDILEELFGDIEDERTVLKKPVPKMRNGRIVIPGKMRMESLAGEDFFLDVAGENGNVRRAKRKLEVLRCEENETVGGFVFDLFGRLPDEGEKTSFGGLVFTVERKKGKRIDEVGIEIEEESGVV